MFIGVPMKFVFTPSDIKSPHPEDSQPLHGEQNAFVGANDLS